MHHLEQCLRDGCHRIPIQLWLFRLRGCIPFRVWCHCPPCRKCISGRAGAAILVLHACAPLCHRIVVEMLGLISQTSSTTNARLPAASLDRFSFPSVAVGILSVNLQTLNALCCKQQVVEHIWMCRHKHLMHVCSHEQTTVSEILIQSAARETVQLLEAV
jgi:hypothetical protein